MTALIPSGTSDVAHSLKIAGAVQLDKLKPEDVSWLWPARIPIGRLTLLVGDPGLGKSLITLDVAARVSRGAAWPDTPVAQPNSSPSPNPQSPSPIPESRTLNPPASVLLLTAEDDITDTVLPRLQAADADCSRIVAIPSIVSPFGAGDAPAHFILQRELARINQLLDHLPDCRLVVVDPVSAYLTGSANSSAEVRRLLAPLAQLAHHRRLAVLAVSHLRKRGGAAIYRTLGSQVFVSAARAVWLISRDPADPSRRLMLPIKNNLADDRAGLAFHLPLPPGEGRGEGVSGEGRVEGALPQIQSATPVPTIHWHPNPITTDADTALHATPGHRRTERDDAIEWLQEKLAAGPLPARQIQDEAEAHAIRLITLRRAFRDLQGQAVRVGYGDLGGWLWRLPNPSA